MFVKGGRYSTLTNEQLNAEYLASEVLNKAKNAEENTTKFMKLLENNGGKLEGLDFRLKSQESLSRKILSDSHVKGVSLEEAASDIGDSLRYTLTTSDSNYTQVVNSSLKQLQGNGYKINKIKNYWGEDIYQGINVSLTTPDGVKMELQFHTDTSYYTKEVLNHKFYEIARSESATTDEIAIATEKMIENQSQALVPKDAEKIKIEEFFDD